MQVNLCNAAVTHFEREVIAEAENLLSSGRAVSISQAMSVARITVGARLGEPPTIAKVLHDQGGPLSGQTVIAGAGQLIP